MMMLVLTWYHAADDVLGPAPKTRHGLGSTSWPSASTTSTEICQISALISLKSLSVHVRRFRSWLLQAFGITGVLSGYIQNFAVPEDPQRSQVGRCFLRWLWRKESGKRSSRTSIENRIMSHLCLVHDESNQCILKNEKSKEYFYRQWPCMRFYCVKAKLTSQQISDRVTRL